MSMSRIFVDFHNADAQGRLQLNCIGTIEYLSREYKDADKIYASANRDIPNKQNLLHLTNNPLSLNAKFVGMDAVIYPGDCSFCTGHCWRNSENMNVSGRWACHF
jgi:hypothetical protein